MRVLPISSQSACKTEVQRISREAGAKGRKEGRRENKRLELKNLTIQTPLVSFVQLYTTFNNQCDILRAYKTQTVFCLRGSVELNEYHPGLFYILGLIIWIINMLHNHSYYTVTLKGVAECGKCTNTQYSFFKPV